MLCASQGPQHKSGDLKDSWLREVTSGAQGQAVGRLGLGFGASTAVTAKSMLFPLRHTPISTLGGFSVTGLIGRGVRGGVWVKEPRNGGEGWPARGSLLSSPLAQGAPSGQNSADSIRFHVLGLGPGPGPLEDHQESGGLN